MSRGENAILHSSKVEPGKCDGPLQSGIDRSVRSAFLRASLLVAAPVAALTFGTAAYGQAKPDVVGLLPPTPLNGLDIRPALTAAYEDNVYRTNPARAPKTDDFIITPSLGASYQQTFGRQRVRLGGLAGYDVFTQQSRLSKPRFIANGDATLAAGGTCTLSPTGYFRRERSDFGDINTAVQNVQRYGAINVTAECVRAAGLYPSIRYERTTTRNRNTFDYADQTTDSFVGGVGYSKPSLGRLYLYYRHDHTDRPTLDLTNNADQIGLNFIRAISSQIQADIDVQWLRVRSSEASVADYDGPGWKVALSTRVIPNALVTVNTGRRIINDSLASSGYAIQSNVGATARYAFSELTALDLNADYRRRRFRQDIAVPQTPLTSDRGYFYSAGLTRKLSEAITLRADVAQTRRRTNTGASTFTANRATIGIDARF